MASETARKFLLRLAVTLSAGLAGCAWVAVQTAPAKQARPASEHARAVARDFWEAFHAGRYDRIDELLEQHDQTIASEPAEVVTIAHAGWLHAWRLSERARLAPTARVIEDASLARRLFDEAVAMEPHDARYLGFAASFTMAEGDILGDQRLVRQGYYRMRDAVAMFPEFNLFTSGYVMSNKPVDSPQFREGLEQQWQTLDRCFGAGVDRHDPDLRKYLGLETHEGPRRVCWNSWIAPHNWEGFFLNFGDMLARADDLPHARQMYEASRLSASYAQWPWRAVLERRLAQLPSLPQRLANPLRGEPEWTPMINSAFACMACHQSSGSLPAMSGQSG